MHRAALNGSVDNRGGADIEAEHKGVVAGATDQGIPAKSAEQSVVAAVGGDDVVQTVAAESDIGRAGGGDILHIRRRSIADGGEDAIGTACLRMDDVGDVIDHKRVVASAAIKRGNT